MDTSMLRCSMTTHGYKKLRSPVANDIQQVQQQLRITMNFDIIYDALIAPILRYPILVYWIASYKLNIENNVIGNTLLIYSLLVNLFLKLNNRLKTSGPWTPIGNIPNATCVLTGGSKGLGKCILENLIAQFPNLTIIMVDVVYPEFKHKRIHFYHTDLSKPDEVEALLDIIKEKYGQIDLLINCAGTRLKYAGLAATNKDEIKDLFQVNVFSPVRLIQELAPRDTTKQFYLVNVGSVLGIFAPAKISSYAGTKSALRAFHESWTYELQAEGYESIRTLLVIPGQLNSSLFQGFEPPRQFFAPVVDCDKLARKIVKSCKIGLRGEICAPNYAYILNVVASMPYTIFYIARRLIKMDTCLPTEGD
ncbi:HCL258Cp [Eremothecium sinecaudum]|uniref:HCL258Cp n=1 Tax=Eremothecium sinecaudum TaxID=45286 RepID=A0A109UZ85_9SACH|nr:HCL258Cp [Eremothecium sinecaudum]AMD19893.1 HCL258Cp [Eremothecium sinecaudum]